MYKNILMVLGLLLFTACSQNKPEPKVQTAIIEPLKVEVQTEVATSEFIPEHIKRSRIEVVKHY